LGVTKRRGISKGGKIQRIRPEAFVSSKREKYGWEFKIGIGWTAGLL